MSAYLTSHRLQRCSEITPETGATREPSGWRCGRVILLLVKIERWAATRDLDCVLKIVSKSRGH